MNTILQPGDICAGHEILGHLGTGGSGEVYAARLLLTGDLRAFKLMIGKGDLFAKARQRFVQEGEALTYIVHPNVVRYYDAGEWAERLWISLEHIVADTLGQRLRGLPRPSLDDVFTWIQQVCDGLGEAHRMGIVHRDLTPDNILVMRAGGMVKIIDFGLAKLLMTHGVETTTDQVTGSARYMSPEQVEGLPASPTMDVYSIGHILYEALAGVHAMGPEARSVCACVSWQLVEHPRPLRELAPWVPEDLAALVHELLDKDPGRRPANARVVNARIREIRRRMWAPERRAALNALSLDTDERTARTLPMPACSEPTPDRVAVLPTAPPPGAPAMPPATLPRPAPAPERRTPEPAGPNTLRSTDTPVESAARRPSATPTRIRAAALVAGVALLIAAPAAWMLLGRLPGAVPPPAPAPASEPHPAASALPPATATASAPAPSAPAPTATTSASASAAPSALPRPAKTTPHAPPARPPQRPPAGTPPAKHRVFGTSD